MFLLAQDPGLNHWGQNACVPVVINGWYCFQGLMLLFLLHEHVAFLKKKKNLDAYIQ